MSFIPGCKKSVLMWGLLFLAGVLPALGIAAESGAAQGLPQDGNEIRQKLDFVDAFVYRSDAVKRIEASSDSEAKSRLRDAQSSLAAARTAFAAGDLREVRVRLEDALGLMSSAAKLVPSESVQKTARRRYEQLLRTATEMEASYQRNHEAFAGRRATGSRNGLDMERIHGMNTSAQALAGQGKYDEANKVLAAIMAELSTAIKALVSGRTISYEMIFATAREEYEYEVKRFASLDEVVPLAVEQQKPSPSVLAVMEMYVGKARDKRAQAEAEAKRGDFDAALRDIKAGTEHLETAFRVVGVL